MSRKGMGHPRFLWEMSVRVEILQSQSVGCKVRIRGPQRIGHPRCCGGIFTKFALHSYWIALLSRAIRFVFVLKQAAGNLGNGDQQMLETEPRDSRSKQGQKDSSTGRSPFGRNGVWPLFSTRVAMGGGGWLKDVSRGLQNRRNRRHRRHRAESESRGN